MNSRAYDRELTMDYSLSYVLRGDAVSAIGYIGYDVDGKRKRGVSWLNS